MAMNLKMINQLEMAKTPIAMEVNSSSPSLRAWIAVYPKLPNIGIDFFEVRAFEIKKELVEASFSQDEVLNCRSEKVKTIDHVEDVLAKWGMVSAHLQVPWQCDYPL